MQQRLEEKVAESAKYYGINFPSNNSAEDVETEDGNEADLEGEGLDADLATGNKDTCVLEVNKYKINMNLEYVLRRIDYQLIVHLNQMVYWFLFKIDDLDDANILDSLMDQFPPPNILVYSTEEIIGLSPEHVVKCCQSFTQVTSDLILKCIRFLKYYSSNPKEI